MDGDGEVQVRVDDRTTGGGWTEYQEPKMFLLGRTRRVVHDRGEKPLVMGGALPGKRGDWASQRANRQTKMESRGQG